MLTRAPPQVILATAGHINHGKSALVTALTGSNPDRLPAEQQRGMTIELGYAFAPGADYGMDVDLAFIDCPGHSRFIRQAIAGLGAMRAAILVVAANEGVSAQTLEHLAVLRLLSVRWGRVVISKADCVDPSQLGQVQAQIRDAIAGSVLAEQPPLVVSAHSGQGIDALRTELFTAAQADRQAYPLNLHAPLRLGIDRVFTLTGHGTVVTGTILRGSIALRQHVCIGGQHSAQVRSLQVRGLAVETAEAGQRCAINLSGIKRDLINRGDWLSALPAPSTSTHLDVRLAALPPGVTHAHHYTCHHGTSQVRARISLYDCDHCQDGSAYAQLRLNQPLAAEVGDRLIIRRASPSNTVAGAQVLAVDAPRHRRYHSSTRSWFNGLLGSRASRLLTHLESIWPQAGNQEACQRALGSSQALSQAITEAGNDIISRPGPQGTMLWTRNGWQRLAQAIHQACQQAQSNGKCWHPYDRLRQQCFSECGEDAFRDRLQALQADGSMFVRGRLCCDPAAVTPLPPRLLASAQRQLGLLYAAGLQPGYDHPRWQTDIDPAAAEQAQALAEERGWLVRLDDRRCLHRQPCLEALQAIADAVKKTEGINIQWFKQVLNLTRRDAIPLAEWCDRQGLTQRQGNQRIAGKQRDPNAIMPPLLQAMPDHSNEID